LVAVRETIDTAYRRVGVRWTRELVGIGELTSDRAVAAINVALRGSVGLPGTTLADLRALAVEKHVLGAPAAEWWSTQSTGMADRFVREMRMGLANGETIPELLRRLRGERTGSTRSVVLPDGTTKAVPTYVGGVLDVAENHALSLVRTSAQSIANQVLLDTYTANADILRGVQAVATLDFRTSDICISRDGALWTLDGEPMPGSPRDEPFPGPPPWHFRCRSVLVPLTRSWAEILGIPDSDRLRQIEREVDDAKVRAAMGGPEAARLTVDGWLRRQSAAEQIARLGRGRWELWRSGKITAAQLVDMRGRSLTIAELRERANLVHRVPAGVR
jgi:hypothetical protein